jgi:hypothetical protein
MRLDAASERGDIVLGWLTRVVVTLAIVAVIAFDSIAIVTSRLGVTDDAQSAAEAANTAWNEHPGSVQEAYNAAAAFAEQHGEECPVKDFSVSPAGVVKLRLTGKATTLVVGHVGPMKTLTEIHGAGEATTPSQ